MPHPLPYSSYAGVNVSGFKPVRRCRQKRCQRWEYKLPPQPAYIEAIVLKPLRQSAELHRVRTASNHRIIDLLERVLRPILGSRAVRADSRDSAGVQVAEAQAWNK